MTIRKTISNPPHPLQRASRDTPESLPPSPTPHEELPSQTSFSFHSVRPQTRFLGARNESIEVSLADERVEFPMTSLHGGPSRRMEPTASSAREGNAGRIAIAVVGRELARRNDARGRRGGGGRGGGSVGDVAGGGGPAWLPLCTARSHSLLARNTVCVFSVIPVSSFIK